MPKVIIFICFSIDFSLLGGKGFRSPIFVVEYKVEKVNWISLLHFQLVTLYISIGVLLGLFS